MNREKWMNYSVLMSVYKNDNPRQISQAIESMLSQSIPPEQYVVVIDGPIHAELSDVIEKYENQDKAMFSVVRLDKNGGLGNALNHGIRACRNELIARMDADDISKCDRCEKQLKAFADNPQLDIVGTQITEFIDDVDHVVSSRRVPVTQSDILDFSRRRSPFNHPTVMYRKSTLERMGGYTAYGRKEDLDLFIRMVHNGCVACNLEESLLYYRTSTDNLKRRKTWTNCKEYIQIMFRFYRRGYIRTLDLMYVVVGQLMMFVLPLKLTQTISDTLLREKHDTQPPMQ